MESNIAFTDAAEAEKYVLNAVGDVEVGTDTYEQLVEKGISECLLKYYLTDVSDDTRYVYEFNLKDLDVKKISLKQTGEKRWLQFK